MNLPGLSSTTGLQALRSAFLAFPPLELPPQADLYTQYPSFEIWVRALRKENIKSNFAGGFEYVCPATPLA